MDNLKKLNVLITGASGLIGRYLCGQLSGRYTLHGIDIRPFDSGLPAGVQFDQLDILDTARLSEFFSRNHFDAVIHCAGSPRQIFGRKNDDGFRTANTETTRRIAAMAADRNPQVHFIYFSSVLVYGENLPALPVDETCRCRPDCGYSKSKREAETLLGQMTAAGRLNTVSILRLAQVYDRDHTGNLDKRIFAPGKAAYLKYGSGSQKMSALSRGNLKDFIVHLISGTGRRADTPGICIYNTTDEHPYSFSDIIQVFRTAASQPNRMVIPVPLWILRAGVACLGFLVPRKKPGFVSALNKLSLDFIYDNNKMLQTGFTPEENLTAVFLDTNTEKPGNQ